jgi:hypothetical protein
MPSILKSALFAAAATVVGSSAAFAIPTTCYGGVCIPQTGTYIDNSLSWETLVTKPTDVLSGIFKATSIADNLSNLTYNGYGAGGVFLAGVFDGFTLQSQVGNQLFFTGGTLKYYSSTTDHFSLTGGSPGADETAIATGTLWASFNAAADSSGHTLVITLNGTPTNFTGASTDDVFLDVNTTTPGIAGLAFDSGTLLDTNSILRDLKFSGTASAYNGTSCSPDFQICGANTAKGFIVQVPEPITVSLFGAGLVGAAVMRRRKAKKA